MTNFKEENQTVVFRNEIEHRLNSQNQGIQFHITTSEFVSPETVQERNYLRQLKETAETGPDGINECVMTNVPTSEPQSRNYRVIISKISDNVPKVTSYYRAINHHSAVVENSIKLATGDHQQLNVIQQKPPFGLVTIPVPS